jgi:transporter family-2 protein
MWPRRRRLADGARGTPAGTWNAATLTAGTVALVAGAGLSVQALLNGRLSNSLNSPQLATLVNQIVGISALAVTGLVSGAWLRAGRRLRSGRGIRWWHLAVAANGAAFIMISAAAAPKVGVTLLAVFLVAGQATGGLVTDRFGLSPAGREDFTLPRLAGAGLALLAVAVGALGLASHAHVLLLALALLAGAALPLMQAGVGQMTSATGEPVVAAGVNFLTVGVCTLLVALVWGGLTPSHGWHVTSDAKWFGGIVGAATVIAMAWAVQALGAFRLNLCVVAGQTIGGMLVDIASPAGAVHVTLATGVSVVLTVVAVAVTGLSHPGTRRMQVGGVSTDRLEPEVGVDSHPDRRP